MPLIIAHRGASAEFPENTLPAFERAIALGADMVEFDVRSTHDQVLIVHHDPNIQGQPIAQLTWTEVQAIDCRIPQFTQVVACCQGRISMDIELKEVGLEQEVWTQIQHLPGETFCITSFHLGAVEAFRQLSSTVQIGYLVSQETIDQSVQRAEAATQCRDRLQAIAINFIAPHWQILDSDGLAALIPADLNFYVWTVNQPSLMAELLKQDRIAGMITDNPDLGLRLRSQV